MLSYLGHRCSLRLRLDGFFFVTNVKCPSSLLTDFSLKSVLLDIRIAIPACFLGPFDWKIFSQPCTLMWCLVFEVEVFFVCSRRMDLFFVTNILACVFFFIDELSPLILWCSWYSWPVIVSSCYFGFVVGGGLVLCVCFPYLDFAGVGLSIAYVFVGVANFLGWSFPSSTFCRAGFVDMYCLNLVLSWNILFSPSVII